MNDTTTPRRLTHTLATIAAAALLAACADQTPLGPDAQPTVHLQPSRAAAGPDLGSCDRLRPPAGSTFGFHTYARGVQIYRWTGSAWAPVGPRADLFADAGGRGKVGIHYAGPYWESLSGSKVKGAVLDRCTPNADAIDWLLLSGTPEGGAGVFQRVTFIQRVNTAGGKAPSTPGTIGEVREVPYTTEYYFYRTP